MNVKWLIVMLLFIGLAILVAIDLVFLYEETKKNKKSKKKKSKNSKDDKILKKLQKKFNKNK